MLPAVPVLLPLLLPLLLLLLPPGGTVAAAAPVLAALVAVTGLFPRPLLLLLLGAVCADEARPTAP
jgi:hypothetical protein